MRRLLVDTTPLRVSSDFRRLWLGQAVSFFGTNDHDGRAAVSGVPRGPTRRSVGYSGLAQLGPLLVFSLIGGALADSFDKRRLCSWSAPCRSRVRRRSGSTRRSTIRTFG